MESEEQIWEAMQSESPTTRQQAAMACGGRAISVDLRKALDALADGDPDQGVQFAAERAGFKSLAFETFQPADERFIRSLGAVSPGRGCARLIRHLGYWALADLDGCHCSSVTVRGFTIHVSCYKCDHYLSVKICCLSMDATETTYVAAEVARQLELDDRYALELGFYGEKNQPPELCDLKISDVLAMAE